MKRHLYSIAILSLLAIQPAVAQSPTNPDLRKELLQMRDADQAVRESDLQTPGEIRALDAADAKHTARLKGIISAHGWPSVSLVGEDGADAAWLLAQHADADPDFQRRVLGLIEPLVATGEVKASNYAYLWDRTHEPQKYGTQGRCVAEGRWEPREIETPETVDTRRAEVGLPPMKDYKKLVSGHCPGGG
jgi:hypothetical protein